MEEIKVRIPRKLVEYAKKSGIDLESKFYEYLQSEIQLDPKDEVVLHLELAQHFLKEGRNFVDGDPVQASEKLYKAAEECAKALALHFDFRDLLEKVEERGRWTVTELEKVVERISDKVGDWFRSSWDSAWVLHVWSFHEAKPDSEAVKRRLKDVVKIVDKTKDMISA